MTRRRRARSFGLCMYGSQASLAVAPSAFHIGTMSSSGISTSLPTSPVNSAIAYIACAIGCDWSAKSITASSAGLRPNSSATGASARYRPTAFTSTSAPTFSGYRVASSTAIQPPSDTPTTVGASRPSRSHTSRRWNTASSIESISSMPSDSPKPGNTGAITSWSVARSSSSSNGVSPRAECRYTSGSPAPPRNSWMTPSGP